jgi:Arc/MetJ-type ribon-helix-helix transcriptional regulator
MAITLTPEQERIINEALKTGRYRNREEALDQTLGALLQTGGGLQSDEEEDEAALDRAIAAWTRRTPEQIAQAQALASAIRPEREVPSGKTLFDMVAGKWPGEETDEEINSALERLS